jgi:glycosyltransferase involved in cell wall biosynthesis
MGHQVTTIGAGKAAIRGDFIATRPNAQGARWHELMPDLIHAAAVADILADLDFDIVHDHTAAGPLIARQYIAPTVVTPHGPIDADRCEYYEHVGDRVGLTAISEAQRRMAPHLNWVSTVYNGITMESFTLVEAKSDYVCFLGRCSPQKGVHLAIDAARAAGVRILLAGTYTLPEHRRYFHETVEPRLGPDAEWIGEVGPQARAELLSNSRALLLPVCWEEPFGLVMIEAMACGTPVVGFRRGAVPEVVTHGVSGFICDDTRQMADAVGRLEELSPANICREARVRFSAETMARGYVDAYERVLSRARSVGTHGGGRQGLRRGGQDSPRSGRRASFVGLASFRTPRAPA